MEWSGVEWSGGALQGVIGLPDTARGEGVCLPAMVEDMREWAQCRRDQLLQWAKQFTVCLRKGPGRRCGLRCGEACRPR